MQHIELKESIETTFGAMPEVSVTLCRDAIEVSLPNGVALLIRVAERNEYAFEWRWGEAEMRIDTAPVHRGLATYPNHLHMPDGTVVADPVSEIDAEPWRNVRMLIERLLAQPLLGYESRFGCETPEASGTQTPVCANA
ncbi:hypothetical protein AB1286_02995 [Trinickia sp. NRRL B-1857]|uniref:hypothetical protein n=1 Tax=Trinickia sp. NRRL B-1857 TaxID=3162879 RepID=UPI003D2D1A18